MGVTSLRFVSLLFVLLVALPAAGGRSKFGRRGAARRSAPAPGRDADQAAPARQQGEGSDLAGLSPAQILERARRHNAALEYDKVIPLAQAVASSPAATADQRFEALQLKGSALAIVGDSSEAERPFRLVLRRQPTFELPAETSPRILAVFRKVQYEERAMAEQMRAIERAELVSSLSIDGALPSDLVGGVPVEVDFKLRDPRGAVDELRLQYRRRGEPNFSSLALRQEESGRWSGAIPSEWTENESGLVIEYYLTTVDDQGEELVRMPQGEPFSVQVAPGSVADAFPFYESVWFWTLVGAAVIASGVAGYIVYDRMTGLPTEDTDVGLYELR